MPKRILLLLVAVCLTLACIFQNSYLKSTTGDLLASLSKIRAACDAKDLDAAEREFSQMSDYWEERANTLCSILEHGEVDLILTELESLGANIHSEQTDFLPANIARLSYYLDHIADWDKFSFYNIF